MSLFFESVRQYRASVYETARGLLRSRNTQAEKAARLAAENQSLKTENANLRAEVKRVQERLDESQQILQKQLECSRTSRMRRCAQHA